VWTIYVRNPLLQREGELDDYQQLEAVKRLNQVGAWVLDLNVSVDKALLLTQPGWGIEVVRTSDGTHVLSGPMTDVKREHDEKANTIRVSGVDDLIHLKDRDARPQPATASPPYSVSEHDVRTGVASTIIRQYVDVNAGPGAIAGRQVLGLSLASDPLTGSSVTGRARWQNLLSLLEELALKGGGLAFDVQQSGSGLSFVVWAPNDRSSTVKFSLELGNLASYTYSLAAPEATYIVCGGGGEGTARTIREGQSSGDAAAWGRRIEKFVDRRDTTDTTELDQEITKTLDESQATTTFSFIPVDLPGMTYLDDYNLGDRVSAVIDDTVTELIREVKILANPGTTRITPSVGTPTLRDTSKLFQRLRRNDKRLNNLERR
jgi:hypothetical protein